MSGWADFAVVIGGATAALLGLFFVAVSIRVDAIAASPELRNRSAQTAALLLTGLLAAALLAVPGQRTWVLGAECLVLAALAAGVALVLDRRAGTPSGNALGRRLDSLNPTMLTCSLLALAAVILVLGHENGAYVLVPALLAVLIGGVLNAWLILLGPPR
jgi:hypothetical protein